MTESSTLGPVDPGGANERFPFPAYPNGWARVGLSEELAVGGVQAIRYFGRDLVLFRTESGRAHVLDAYCRHLGAHLGRGGVVEGESLRCPFHAWRWDGAGRCVEIPYAKRINAQARMHSWPLCEQNGFIFLHYHADGEPPTEAVPEIPEYRDPAWTPYERLRWKIRSRTYDMGENAVDDVHFRYLHGAASLPKTRKGSVRGSSSNLSKMRLDTPRGPVEGSIESTRAPGMGLVYVRGICDTLIVITGTPIDGEYVDQMFSYTQKLDGDEGRQRLARALLRDLEKQMNEDVVVFEHKKYWPQPLLVPEDGPIADYRRRARSDYSGDFASLDRGAATSGGGRTRPPELRAKAESGFSERECDELASYLRSAFGARRVERTEADGARCVEFALLGRGDAVVARIRFDRDSLERLEVSDLRGHLARPRVKKRILEAAGRGVAIRDAELR